MASKRRLPILFAAAALAAAPMGAHAATITDLGTITGPASDGTGINDMGSATGSSTVTMSAAPRHAFRYDGMGLVDLGTLGGDSSFGNAINGPGHVVGASGVVPGDPRSHAFLHDGVGMTDLGLLDGGDTSAAFSLNDLDQGVGFGNLGPGPSAPFHAALFADGAVTDLGTLPGDTHSQATGINQAGKIVGGSGDAQGPRLAFCTPGPPADMRPLPTFGGRITAASAINNAVPEQIVGASMRPDNSTRAFIYQLGDMELTDVGSLGGSMSVALAVNDSGHVVGVSTLADPMAPPHAFMWEAGVITDLNDLLDPGSGWLLFTADGINNAGQVVGTGFHNGALRGYVLTLSPVARAGARRAVAAAAHGAVDASAASWTAGWRTVPGR